MLLLINNLVASYLRHTKLEVFPKPRKVPKAQENQPYANIVWTAPVYPQAWRIWTMGSRIFRKKKKKQTNQCSKQRCETLCSLGSITLGNSQPKQSGLEPCLVWTVESEGEDVPGVHRVASHDLNGCSHQLPTVSFPVNHMAWGSLTGSLRNKFGKDSIS